jgi:hypothetical protein
VEESKGGENRGRDYPQRERECSTDEPTDQFCSSCNQKKPLIDFGRFFTCNTCRERNRRVNGARKVRSTI